MGKKVNYFDFRFRKSLRYEKRHTWDSLVAQMVKSLPTVWETQLQSLGREDPLEKEMATHSSILAWKNPKDRRRTTVHRVTKSWTQPSDFTFTLERV